MEILGIEGESEAERLENGRIELAGMVSTGVDIPTSVVSISVRSRYPTLSAAVANRFVELLNQFNLETRQSGIRAKRLFVENRLSEAEATLHTTEEDLQHFLEQNRQFRGSPELEVQYERLQRRVAIKQEVLVTLSREYEETRIREVDNTPMITVVDHAVPPVRRSTPRRKLIVLVTSFLVGIVTLAWVFASDAIERRGEEDQEFVRRCKKMKEEVRRIVFPWVTKRLT